MTDMRRWLEDGDAPDEVRALLRAGRPAARIPEDARRRGARKIAAAAAVPVGIGVLLWNSGTLFAAALGVGIGLGAAVVGHELSEPNDIDPPRKATVTNVPRRHIEKPDVRAPAPAREAAAAEKVEPPASSSLRPRSPDTLTEEAKLLDQATLRLAANPGDALELAVEHSKKFPKGKLSMERRLIEVDALKRLGRTAEARSRVDQLLSSAPNGLYAPRLRKLAEELGLETER